MADFLLDFRASDQRRQSVARGASLLKFCEDTQVQTLEREAFFLAVSRADGFELWGPHESGKILVALAGRVAFDEPEWEQAKNLGGSGGLACKAILQRYERRGIQGLASLNGNFVVIVHDSARNQVHLATDRSGMMIAYRHTKMNERPVLSSHPDVLAAVTGEAQNWDMASLAEFLMTSRVSFPRTYYRNLRALDTGCVFSFELGHDRVQRETQTRSFRFE